MIIRYLDPWGPGPCPVRLYAVGFQASFQRALLFFWTEFHTNEVYNIFLNPACAILEPSCLLASTHHTIRTMNTGAYMLQLGAHLLRLSTLLRILEFPEEKAPCIHIVYIVNTFALIPLISTLWPKYILY